MLILDIVSGAETYHITKNKNGIWVGGTTFYKPKLEQADSVSLKLNDPFGGFGQINQGDIIILLDLFTDNNQWPPPYKISITAKYLLPNGTSSTVFTADGLLKGFDNTSVTYAVYDTENTDYLLDSAPDFGGETGRVYPLAIGTVTCKKPLRIGTGIEYKYHKAGIAGTTPDVDYHVFDNGVDICSNVTDNLDGTFNLSVTPVGDVRISGTGTIVDIDDLIDYCCGATKLNLTANKTYTRSPSPQLSAWIDKQELIIPFLDEVLSSFSHLFYITGSTLYLVDMFADNGTVNLAASGKEYYQSGYNYNNPLRSFITEWTTTDSGTDGEGYPTYVDDDHTREIIMSGYGATKKFNIIALNISVANIALIDLATTYLRPICTISIPPEFASSIKLGTLINFTDVRIPYDTDVSIRAREIVFNYDNHEIQVKGEGAIFNSPSVPTDSLYLKRQRIDLKGYLDRIAETYTLADGKIVSFYQDAIPAFASSTYGDLWVDTNDNNNLFRFDNNTTVVTTGYKWNGSSYDAYATGIPTGNAVWVDIVDQKIYKYKTYVTVSATATEGEYSTITAAIAALTTGGTIFIKNGTYAITSASIVVNTDIPLEFVGETKENVIISVNLSSPGVGLYLNNNESKVKFENITFYSSNTSDTLLKIQGTTNRYGNLLINNCDFIGGSTGLMVYYFNNVNINHCLFNNNAIACTCGDVPAPPTIPSYSNNYILFTNNIINKGFLGVWSEKDIIVNNNSFINGVLGLGQYKSGWGKLSIIFLTNYSSVNRIQFIDNNVTGIPVIPDANWYVNLIDINATGTFTIKNNNMYISAPTTYVPLDFILLDLYGNGDSKAEDNELTFIDSLDLGIKGIVIGNNEIKAKNNKVIIQNTYGSGGGKVNKAIINDGYDDVIIEGNTIKMGSDVSFSDTAIYLRNCDNTTLRNNNILNADTDLDVDGTVTNIFKLGNNPTI